MPKIRLELALLDEAQTAPSPYGSRVPFNPPLKASVAQIRTQGFSGCSFYSIKGSIPNHLNTVVIDPIINESSEYTIGQKFEDQFVQSLKLAFSSDF